jgi:hypothetical protein
MRRVAKLQHLIKPPGTTDRGVYFPQMIGRAQDNNAFPLVETIQQFKQRGDDMVCV